MTLRPSLSGSSCLPATRSLDRGGEIGIFRLHLVIAKDGTAIRSHEIIDGSIVRSPERDGSEGRPLRLAPVGAGLSGLSADCDHLIVTRTSAPKSIVRSLSRAAHFISVASDGS